jgi:hypothetical protein
MELRTIKTYTFAELSETAKQNAIVKFQSQIPWDRADEYLGSIQALAEHFGGRAVDWELDWANACGPSFMKFEMPSREDSELSKTAWEREIRAKLRALGPFNRRTLKGNGDCKLTGMCYDENAIDGFRFAFYREGERDLSALMQAAFDSWIRAAWADYEYDFDPKTGFAELAEANEWRYLENGATPPRGAA